MSELTIPVCTFGRVFDTDPRNEVLTLPQLTAALRRFEIKTHTAAQIERDVARIEKAVAQLAEGKSPRGKFMGKLAKVAKEAGEGAVEAAAQQLIVDARKSAKRDLRIWSPALYRPGAKKRGASGVTHVSCLVLDYDDGTEIVEASTTWSTWFHIVYTTWSHTPEHHKFRLVMPLSFSVAAEDWGKVWSWAEAHAHFTIDPAMKSPAATYALPAVPDRAWPREAFSRPGAILDPVDEGILDSRSVLTLAPHGPRDGEPSVIRGLDPDHEYVDHEDLDDFYVDDAWSMERDWDASPEMVSAAVAVAPRASAAEPSEPPGRERPANEDEAPSDAPATLHPETAVRLDRVLSQLEDQVRPMALVEGLERVVALHEAGWLTKKELSAAKKRILADAAPPGDLRRVGPGRHRQTLCLDFDGVLHSYSSGWRGPTEIPDAPVDGAIEWMIEAAERWDLAVFSVRSSYPGAVEAIQAWLRQHGLPEKVLARVRFPSAKPPAALYIDDRGYRFEGRFPSFEELGDLEPWNHPRRK